MYVSKSNGEKVKFEKEKVYNTCKRAGVSTEIANKITDEVSAKVQEGMPTRKILDIVLKELKKYERVHSEKYNLKQSLAKLEPENHEFERYMTHLLRADGYETKWDEIIEGECIEHQIDLIAEKDGKSYLVECKHHVNPHRFCGLTNGLALWATYDDINKGDIKKYGKPRYENAWLVTNTKFSEHLTRYANAKGLGLIGWNYPEEGDLRDLIERKELYPLTILNMDRLTLERLTNARILLLDELIDIDISKCSRNWRVGERKLANLVKSAREFTKK